MIEVLYNSSQVRRKIQDLFSTSQGRRVIITAFVGEGAEAFVPRPRGVQVVCWPNPTGTNPHAIRKLISKKAKVYFANRLHMKVYWTARKGAVITSANLSTNALGSGDLKEAGVFLPAGEVDIAKLLSIVKPRPVSKNELLRLEKEYNALSVKHRRRAASTKGTSFKDWYKSAYRTPWLLGWSNNEGDFSKEAIKIGRDEYEVREPYWFIDGRRGDYSKDDWILTFTLKKNGVTDLNWMYTDRVVKVSPKDKAYSKSYPFQAVQMRTGKYYPKPPFVLNSRFRRAITAAVKTFGSEEIENLLKLAPTDRLLGLMLSDLSRLYRTRS
jgi:hypothetical protein